MKCICCSNPLAGWKDFNFIACSNISFHVWKRTFCWRTGGRPPAPTPPPVTGMSLYSDCMLCTIQFIFLARDSIYAIARFALYAIARPSVRLSVTRVDQSKTVKARITQSSPQSSPMTLNFTMKFQRENRERRRRIRQGYEKCAIFSQ